MRVVWSPRAAFDLEEIVDYIAADNPDAALRVANRIYSQITSLGLSPLIGRKGEVSDTRELVFSPWPYIAVYRVIEDQVRIIRIRHSAQKWP